MDFTGQSYSCIFWVGILIRMWTSCFLLPRRLVARLRVEQIIWICCRDHMMPPISAKPIITLHIMNHLEVRCQITNVIVVISDLRRFNGKKDRIVQRFQFCYQAELTAEKTKCQNDRNKFMGVLRSKQIHGTKIIVYAYAKRDFQCGWLKTQGKGESEVPLPMP